MSAVKNVTLSDFCATGSGGTPSRSKLERYYEGGTIPWVKSGELRESIINRAEEYVTDAALKESSIKLVPAGAILLAMYGATVGRLGILGIEATTNQAVCHIVPDPKVALTRYVYHALSSKVPYLISMGVGGAQPNINQGIIKSLAIPLPPLPEQRRIAAILDQADVLRAKRREALAQLDSLTQSIFVEMFGDPVTNPMGWKVESLDISANFFAGNSLPEGVPFVGQKDGFFLMKVSDMNLSGNEKNIERCQSWSHSPGSKSGTCPAGSIIIPKRGGAIGTNKKRVTTRETILDPNLMGIAPKLAIVEREYLFQWFQRFDLSSIASGSSVAQLNKQDLTPLRIQVPPLYIQKSFASRIEAVDEIKGYNNAALNELDTLFASLQHRAFRGDL